MDNIVYIILMIVIIIGSRVFKAFFNKAAKQRLNTNENKIEDDQANYDNEEDAGKNEQGILEELFKDFTIKKDSQVYNKTSSLKQESNLPLDTEIKKYQEPEVDKKTFKEEIEFEPEVKKPFKYSEKAFEDDIINEESSLEGIKKLNYLEQAIILSEILGKPKGFDI